MSLPFECGSSSVISRPRDWGELPGLTWRIEQYFERFKDGHATKGIPPTAKTLIFSSNDYLSIGGDPRIVEAQVRRLREFGDSVLMSAVFLHSETEQRAFERRIARFMGAEDAVLCQSGWCANDGLIQTLADQTIPIYFDMFAHMSFWQGAQSAGVKARPFRHNSVENLAALIRKNGPGIVGVDSVYSTTGDIAPLAELAELCEAEGCLLIVDESHSAGVFGASGEGLVAMLGLQDRVPYRTLSMSKAFASRAGLVVGPSRALEFYRYESRPAIFSSAVVPHEIAAFEASLDVIEAEGPRRTRLQESASYLRNRLDELGYNVDISQTQIIALEAGTEAATIRLRRALESRHIQGAVFCAPATPKNRALVRFSVTAAHTPEQLDRVAEVCAEIRDEVGMRDWPSTQRKSVRSRRLTVAA
ncbi:MAG: quorum-sensing autoinducer CAI-1 synthase [Alphaproteobacteria bacterium]|nr:quorum-sensing autoinducer CAI-1 synthase [Alphaproteobacteria bacterium]